MAWQWHQPRVAREPRRLPPALFRYVASKTQAQLLLCNFEKLRSHGRTYNNTYVYVYVQFIVQPELRIVQQMFSAVGSARDQACRLLTCMQSC